MSDGTQRLTSSSALLSSRGGGPDDMRGPFGPAPFHLLSSRGDGPNDMRRQIMVIPLTFCHPDTIVSDSTHRLTSSSALLSSRGVGPDDMRGPFGPALFHLLSSRGGGPDDMREPFGPALFHLFVIQRRQARWHAGNHLIPHLFHSPETIKSDSARRQIMVIRAFRRPRGTNLTISG